MRRASGGSISRKVYGTIARWARSEISSKADGRWVGVRCVSIPLIGVVVCLSRIGRGLSHYSDGEEYGREAYGITVIWPRRSSSQTYTNPTKQAARLAYASTPGERGLLIATRLSKRGGDASIANESASISHARSRSEWQRGWLKRERESVTYSPILIRGVEWKIANGG